MGPDIKLANAIGIPILFVALLVLVSTFGTADTETDTPCGQVFFQRKGKLDEEEEKLCELAAKEVRHEIGADGERYEMLVDEKSHSIQKMQELRGEEHLKEREAPQ